MATDATIDRASRGRVASGFIAAVEEHSTPAGDVGYRYRSLRGELWSVFRRVMAADLPCQSQGIVRGANGHYCGGDLSPVVTGIAVDLTGSFASAFGAAALFYVTSGIAWIFGVDKVEPLVWDERPPPSVDAPEFARA